MRKLFTLYSSLFTMIVMTILSSCARMGGTLPDGGWYDEDPPKIIGATPQDRGVNVSAKKITIQFDEYIKVDNATENVIVSPPQLEQPEIKAAGKSIVVELKDTLKENTTYTVDFSDAISDNNEGNPLGNYTYSFSTGDEIDTLEVGGYVLDPLTLDPIQGILVGLYLADEDSAKATVNDEFSTQDNSVATPFDSTFYKKPFLRVARTDANGHFVIKGVKEGKYKVYALKDQDNNFMLTPNSGEMIGFYDDIISPWVFDDTRQDTIWTDSLHIKNIDRVPYKHYMPDNIVLRAFTEVDKTRAYIKCDRQNADRFTLFYSYGDSILPEIKGLNFNSDNAFLLEPSAKNDTLTYWLRDTTLVNTDSLEFSMTYRMTDTLGDLVLHTDTIMALPKTLYAKRMKEKQKEFNTWQKQQEKNKKKGMPYDSIMPPAPLKCDIKQGNTMDPDKNITIEFPTPLAQIDSSKIHLYVKVDSLWYNAEWQIRQKPNTNIRTYELLAEWRPQQEYSFELDSLAFTDIYGSVTNKEKKGFKVKGLDEYGTFQVTMTGMKGKHIIAQLMEGQDKIVKQVITDDGVAKFFYLGEKKYYLRIIEDYNNNGVWDTGKFDEHLQPEPVYYYPEEINCRVKWNLTETWNPTLKPLNEQKPAGLAKKSNGTKKKIKQDKNLKRAQQLGIQLPDYLK